MPSFFDIECSPETIARAREGDPAAAEALYLAFAGPVRTLVRRLVSRRAAREDLAQDVFVEVLARLRQYDGRGSFAGWVRAITVNTCLMHLRSPWQRGLRWLTNSIEGCPDEAAGEPAVLEGEALDLDRALARLSDTSRLVVWLHDVEGYTHAEIGALLGGTPSLSKSQLARAHSRLRQLLDPNREDVTCMQASTSC